MKQSILEDQRLCPLAHLALAQRHEWSKRQLERAGISYRALDNGFRSGANPAALQKICNRLGPAAVKSFFWRWVHRLPSPFPQADLRAGYVYELAFRQFEISHTCMFDRPQAGRMWFEGVIRDHVGSGEATDHYHGCRAKSARSRGGAEESDILGQHQGSSQRQF